VRGSLLDLRTRGFLPIGGSMQGMGIIHHMELAWVVDARAASSSNATRAADGRLRGVGRDGG